MRALLPIVFLAVLVPLATAASAPPAASMEAAGPMEDACGGLAAIHVTGVGAAGWIFTVQVVSETTSACGGGAIYDAVFSAPMMGLLPNGCVLSASGAKLCLDGPLDPISIPPSAWDVTFSSGAYSASGRMLGVLTPRD